MTRDDCYECRAQNFCGDRGCDEPQKHPVFRDSKMVLYSCPVLDFHAKIPTLELFHLCHRLEHTSDTLRYVRTAMPNSGGLENQDVRLLAEFSIIENELLDLEVDRRKHRDEKRKKRKK